MSMEEWNIEKHGDVLERKAVGFIRQSIPSYEETWKRFIGHKGNGMMASMTAISEENDRVRRDFAQHHYTVLESLFLMNEIRRVEELKPVRTFEDYTAALNHIMVYQAYAGRIRDNIRNCFIILDKPNLAKDAENILEEFYSQRHVFVHGKKLPFFIDGNSLFYIAKPKKSSTDQTGFGKKMLWEDVTEEDHVLLGAYLNESVQTLSKLVNSQLEFLLQEVKAIIATNTLVLEAPPVDYLSLNLYYSASQDIYHDLHSSGTTRSRHYTIIHQSSAYTSNLLKKLMGKK